MPDPEPVARLRREIVIAAHRGDSGPARNHLRHEDPGVRETALSALARAGRLAAADLVQGLQDAETTVRLRAAELVADRPGDEPPPLGPVLSDEASMVVEAAAWASGERQPPEPGIVAHLVDVATGHPEPLCREAAVAALGAIGDEQGLPAIVTATRDKPAVRRRAVLALAPFSGPEVEEAMERALEDRDWQVRQAAQDVSGRS